MNRVVASGGNRDGVPFAVRPQREGAGRLEQVALVIPGGVGQRLHGIIAVQWLHPSVRDALAIGREHEDVGRATAASEPDRQRAEVGGFQLEIDGDVDAGEDGELRQQRRDRIRPRMDRARKCDRLSRKLLPVDRGVGVSRSGILGKAPARQRGQARASRPQSLDETARGSPDGSMSFHPVP